MWRERALFSLSSLLRGAVAGAATGLVSATQVSPFSVSPVAHRIGQTRNVFAYRLIARGTVEEKVLELQASKRDLAAAIIQADNSLIRNLKREDLELLLS